MPTAPSRRPDFATEEEDDLTPLPPAVQVQPRSTQPVPPVAAPAPRAPNPALGMDAPDLATRTAATKLQLGQRVTGSELGRIAERQRLEAGGGTTQGGPGMDAPDRAVRVAGLKAQAGMPLSDKEVRRVADRQRLEGQAPGLPADRSITPLLSGSRLDPRGTFAQQQAQARRDEVERRRGEIAAQTEARKTRNATLEAEMRGTGQRFYTDPFGDIQPIVESGTGRAIYAETPWEDGGEHPKTKEPALVKRDRYGQRQYKSAPLVRGADPHDTQLYYKFADDDLRPAGEAAKFRTHANPTVARLAKRVDADNRQAMWKEAIMPMEAAKAAVDTEVAQAEQRTLDIQGQIDGITQQLAAITPEMASQKTGGVLGFGGTLTPQAVAAQSQQTALQQQLAALTQEQSNLQERLKPLAGDLGRKRRTADLHLKMFKAKAQYEAYADLAEERRDILKAQGKSEADDPTLKSILQAQRTFQSAVEGVTKIADREAQVMASVPAVTAPPAPEEVGTLGGIVQSGKKAALQTGAAFNVLGAEARLGKRDQYLGQATKLEEQAANIDALQPQWSPENRVAFADRALKTAEILRGRAAQMGESAGGEMASAADRIKRAASITASSVYEGYQGAKGWEAVSRFLQDPVEISSNIATEGLIGSAPSVGLGIAGAVTGGIPGAAAGAGLGSFAQEYASTLVETMNEMGVDVTNPQQISQAFADPEVMDAARLKGVARGIPVALFDAFSGGIAGRTLAPAVRTGVKQAIKAGVRETAEQAALGMAGEAAGQVSEQVASTGGVQGLNMGDIAAEGIGEIMPGGAQIGTGAVVRSIQQRNAAGAPPAGPQAPAAPAPEPTPAPAAPQLPTDPAQAEAEFQRRLNEDQPAAPVEVVPSTEAPQPAAEIAATAPEVVEDAVQEPVAETPLVNEQATAPAVAQPTPAPQPPAPIAAPEPSVVAAEAGESASAPEVVAPEIPDGFEAIPGDDQWVQAKNAPMRYHPKERVWYDPSSGLYARDGSENWVDFDTISGRATPEPEPAPVDRPTAPSAPDFGLARYLGEEAPATEAPALEQRDAEKINAPRDPSGKPTLRLPPPSDEARTARNSEYVAAVKSVPLKGSKAEGGVTQYGDWAIKPSNGVYTVTHVPSGLTAQSASNINEARDIIRAFTLSGVDSKNPNLKSDTESLKKLAQAVVNLRTSGDGDGAPAWFRSRRPLPANARITIQEPAIPGEPRSGYTQIDLIREDGESEGSFSPESLREQGYEIPDLSKLKTGQYGADLRPVGQQAAPASVAAPEATPETVAGQPINKEWTAFSPDSGTLNIPRAEMPQVKSEARGALINFLRARDVQAKRVMVNPGDLKPTQAEFSEKKVEAARKHTGTDRPILISSDGHVVDGHHQWVAALDDRETPMPAIRLDAPIEKILAEMKEFPSTENAPGATAPKAAEAEPSVSSPKATKLLSDRAIEALQKAKLNKPGSGRVLAADPFTLAYDGAIDLAILGLRAGRPVEQVVRMAIARFKAKHAKATAEELTKLEGDIRTALAADATPKPATPKQQPSRLPESLKAAGAPAETINYEVRSQEVRRREASEIISEDGRTKAEADLANPDLPGDTRVAIGGQLLNERMLALRDAKPEEIGPITRDIRRITAKMQPELATEAGQTISMIGGILKDIRVAAALDYIKTTTNKRVEKMGGADALQAAQDAADAVNAAKTDAEKAAAITKLKDRYTTKPVRRMLEGLEGIEKIKELNKLGVLTRDDMIEVAGNALGIPGASPDKLKRIAELSDRIENAKNHSEKSRAELELAETMQSYKGVSPLDLESSMLTASILSGPTTQLANLQGNALNTLVQLGTTAAVNPTRLPQLVRGIVQGIPLGFQQAGSILATGRGTKDFQDFSGGRGQINPLQTVDYTRDFGVPAPAGKALTVRARALEKVFRFMKAVDATFYYPAREAYARLAADKLLSGAYSGAELNKKVSELLHTTPESFASARAQAEAEGYSGIDLSRRVADIIEERRASTADGAAATKQAEQFAAETTYTNEPVGIAGVMYRNLSRMVGEIPALKPWLMFLKTPANVFNAATNLTPLGAARAQFGMRGEKYRKGGTGEGQWRNFNKDERARLYLQSAVGTALMGGLIYQVLDKKEIDLTGKGPSDANKRRQLMQGGWRPYSLKIGDRWVSYRDSPLLIPLSIAGNFTDAVKFEGARKNEDLGKKAALAMARFPETIFQTSMLTGLADLMGSLSGRGGSPESIGRTLGSLPANMAIPYNRFLQQIDQSFDEQTYDNNPVMGAVPFARRAGQPQVDVQGRPNKYDPWGRFSSKDSGDPVDRLIREKNIFIPEVGRDTRLGKDAVTDAQWEALRRISGQRIRVRIQASEPKLRALTPEKAQDEIDRIAREEREKVKPLIKAGVGVRK